MNDHTPAEYWCLRHEACILKLTRRHSEIAASAAQPRVQIGYSPPGWRWRSSPAAVTTSADNRLSQDRPYLPESQPVPPQASLAMPVSEFAPPVVA